MYLVYEQFGMSMFITGYVALLLFQAVALQHLSGETE
tara:strand:+ start:612 stop:722 length:111 start_codon:yes stop_codon:yes gene_type:complete